MSPTFPNESVHDKPMEPQTWCGWFDDPKSERGFIDLLPVTDDKRVLKNPHKGWFWHFIDNGNRGPLYRDRNKPGDYLEDFPGLNHLYLRFDWSDVEVSKGVYDFGFLDKIMDEWGPKGYAFSLRVCCFETSFPGVTATPPYVFEEGAKCYTVTSRNLVQPDYGDPYFLERLELFMAEMGRKFNNDPRVDIVDVGTYGTWGEGHTVEGDGYIYPLDVVKKHIDLHLKYFPDKYILINDDHIVGRIIRGHEECQEMLDYAYERGLGIQDDSICCDYYSVVNGYDTMRATRAFQKLSKNAPSCIEFAHYSYIHPTFDDYYRNGLTIVECLKNSHATFAGFHGYPRVFLRSDKWLADYCANRLGYWYFAESALIPELTATAHNHIKVAFRNRGWARAYYRHEIALAIADDSGNIVRELRTGKCVDDLDQEEACVFDVNLDLRDIADGEYDILLGVFENDKPIKLALKEETEAAGGYYRIARRKIRAV
ncbi:MAG: DUF4832 domain-containing protein [Clostridia bacterium]|nr:DUF4832 domain-containing protein [Clostridia bacterium]